jgi:prophage regulatory protein
LRGRAADVVPRIGRDSDLLADVHRDLEATLIRLMPVVAAAAAATSSSSASSSSSAAAAAAAAAPPLRLLRVDDVADRLGLSRSQIWRMVSEGRFPKPRRLSVRAVAWLEPEVARWIVERPLFDVPNQPMPRARR